MIRIVFNLFLFLLSYLVPKKKHSILLGSGLGKSFKGNPKYIYLYLLNKKLPIQFSWITENRLVVDDFKKRNWPITYKWSLKGFLSILKADKLIIESGTIPGVKNHDIAYERLLYGKFRIIQTWHGTPLKYICLDTFKDKKNSLYSKIKYYLQRYEFERYALLPVQSSYEVSIYKKAFNNKNVNILGNARNDMLINHGKKSDNYRNSLNIVINKKIICYAPTFRDKKTNKIPFSEKGWNKLNEYLNNRNYKFLIKKHPFDRQLHVPSNYDNINDISEKVEDIQELLINTDILITDYSSVSIDFSLLNRPIIYYIYDYEEYVKSRKFYVNIHDTLPGPFAKNEEELFSLLFTTEKWWNSPKYVKKYKIFVNKFHYYNDGESAKRLIEWCYN
jgi:CDP-glycerol glycerophosphotransferase